MRARLTVNRLAGVEEFTTVTSKERKNNWF
jgi:hypothetical protein